jgi:hypothetical protein
MVVLRWLQRTANVPPTSLFPTGVTSRRTAPQLDLLSVTVLSTSLVQTASKEVDTSVLNSLAELAAMTAAALIPLFPHPQKATRLCIRLNEVFGLFLLTPVLAPRLDA